MKMMRITVAQRYVLGVFGGFFLLSVFIFSALIVMVNFLQILHEGVLQGFSFLLMSRTLLHLLPNVLALVVPIAFLMALLMSLGQLSRDGEIMALRAAGFSFGRILSPLIWAAAAAALLTAALGGWAGPRGLKRSNDYVEAMASRITHIELRPRTFRRIADWTFYADEADPVTGRLAGVKLTRRVQRAGSEPQLMRISAAQGRYGVAPALGIKIELDDGTLSQSAFSARTRLMHGGFSSYRTLIPFFSGDAEARQLRPRELTTPALLGRLSAGVAEAGLDLRYRMEIVSRISVALAPLVFFLLGAPLGLVLDSKARSSGFAASLLVIFLYYGLTVGGMVLSRKDPSLFPWAMMAPTAAGALAGAWLWRRKLSFR
ncbi:MAG: permease YjgP/YjgQ family protein [Elusimicrobia bacterium]|nr:MAG: permease YjgP/YjgQ family protein [Elusimicrobiota bacterium]KAF0157361.1 MAG: permease YjgP/YjgQ family protein [Elusimicrobiota bacterium]